MADFNDDALERIFSHVTDGDSRRAADTLLAMVKGRRDGQKLGTKLVNATIEEKLGKETTQAEAIYVEQMLGSIAERLLQGVAYVMSKRVKAGDLQAQVGKEIASIDISQCMGKISLAITGQVHEMTIEEVIVAGGRCGCGDPKCELNKAQEELKKAGKGMTPEQMRRARESN